MTAIPAPIARPTLRVPAMPPVPMVKVPSPSLMRTTGEPAGPRAIVTLAKSIVVVALTPAPARVTVTSPERR